VTPKSKPADYVDYTDNKLLMDIGESLMDIGVKKSAKSAKSAGETIVRRESSYIEEHLY